MKFIKASVFHAILLIVGLILLQGRGSGAITTSQAINSLKDSGYAVHVERSKEFASSSLNAVTGGDVHSLLEHLTSATGYKYSLSGNAIRIFDPKFQEMSGAEYPLNATLHHVKYSNLYADEIIQKISKREGVAVVPVVLNGQRGNKLSVDVDQIQLRDLITLIADKGELKNWEATYAPYLGGCTVWLRLSE